MKAMKMLIAASGIVVAAMLSGCGRNKDGWYPINGGYINLRNVKVVTSQVSGWDLGTFAITEESVAKAKERVKANTEAFKSGGISSAYIKFDDFTVTLQTDAKSYKDVLRLLDYYLDEMESIKLPEK